MAEKLTLDYVQKAFADAQVVAHADDLYRHIPNIKREQLPKELHAALATNLEHRYLKATGQKVQLIHVTEFVVSIGGAPLGATFGGGNGGWEAGGGGVSDVNLVLVEPTIAPVEPAFVIERWMYSELYYWTGDVTDPQNSNSAFHQKFEKAMRFARAEDAAIILSRFLHGQGKVSKYLFPVNQPKNESKNAEAPSTS